MSSQPLLRIAPDSPEVEPVASPTPRNQDPWHIDHQAAKIAGVVFRKGEYLGPLAGDDNMRDYYLREAKQYPLLSPEDEIAYALQMREAKTARSAADNEDWSEISPHQAELAIADGLRAQSILICSNLLFVAKIANSPKYLNRGLTLMELNQEGTIGLIEGIEGFDPDKGFRLNTYTAPFIRGAISRAIMEQGTTVVVNPSRAEIIRSLFKNIATLRERLKAEPSLDQIVEYTGLEHSRVEELMANSAIRSSVSMSAIVNEESEGGMTLNDESAQSPFGRVLNDLTAPQVHQLLDSLDERERDIVMSRFGFFGDIKTFEEIGSRWGVTKQCVQQLEETTLEKLRTAANRVFGPEDLE